MFVTYAVQVSVYCELTWISVNTLRLLENGEHVVNNIFKCIFFNVDYDNSMEILLQFVPRGPINNMSALVKVIVRCQIGVEQFPEPMTTMIHNA